LADAPRRPSALTALGIALALAACGGPPPPLNKPAAMEPMRGEKDAPALGIRVSYAVGGSPAGVPVVLVHGTPGSAGAWVDYVVDPVAGTRTYAIDRPGFGRTHPADVRTRLADQADAVLAVLPDDRPAVLVGHSLGGPVVAWAAAAHPERVAALVLLAASLDPDLERIHPLQPVGEWWPVRNLLPGNLRNANLELMGLQAELELLRDRLGDIRCPVVIVHGTDDDLVPYANVPFMVARLTGARSRDVRTLDRFNHFLPWNAQDEVRAAIARAVLLAGAP
jgi:pimeloyl-ACP methyl ester carboxylesterase